jgi:hypothetical protein
MDVNYSELLAHHFADTCAVSKRRRESLDAAFGAGFADRFVVTSAVYMALPENAEAQDYATIDVDFMEEETENEGSSACSSKQFWTYWSESTNPSFEDEDVFQSSIQKLVWRPIVSRLLRLNFARNAIQGGESRRNRTPPFDPVQDDDQDSDSTAWTERCTRHIEKAMELLDRMEAEETCDPTTQTLLPTFAKEDEVEVEEGSSRPWRKNLEQFYPRLRSARCNFLGSYRLGGRLSWEAMLRLACPKVARTAEELLWSIELVANGWDPAELLDDGLQEMDQLETGGPEDACREAVAFANAFSQALNWCDAANSPGIRAMWQDAESGPFGYCPFGALCAVLPSADFPGWSRTYPIYKNVANQFAFFARRSGGSSWLGKLAEDFAGKNSPASIDQLAAEAKTTNPKELDFLRARRIVAGLVARKDKFLLPMISDSGKCDLAALPFSDPTCANCQEPLARGDCVAFYECNHAVHVNCLCAEIRSKTDPEDTNCRCAYRCDAGLDFARKHVRLV